MNDGSRRIEKTLELLAPVPRVWAALTEPAQLAAWFPDAVEGLAPKEGSEGWLVWNEHGRYAITVESLDTERRIVWRWARQSEAALAGGYNTVVEWTLEAREGGGTTLRLVESGFANESDRQENVGGWEHELAELTDYLEGRTHDATQVRA